MKNGFTRGFIMFCAKCGTENQKGDEFCSKCGNKLNMPTLTDKVLGKEHEGLLCPNCKNHDFNDNFCVRCGYNLNDVLGYYKADVKGMLPNHFFLEINKKHLQIIVEVERMGKMVLRYVYRYQFSKIYNLFITTCKGGILSKKSHPCLKFDYNGLECSKAKPPNIKLICKGNTLTLTLNEEQITEIKEILSDVFKEQIISEY